MSLAPMDKDTVIDIIAGAVSFIPFYGDYIGSGITLAKGFRKLFRDASKAEQIIDTIQRGVFRSNLSEDDAKSVCAAIQGMLHDKETDLHKIARDDNLIQKMKDDILKASDHRKDAEYQYRQYISDAVNFILSPDILPLFTDCDQIAVENLHEIKELLESNDLIYERLTNLETRVNNIEQTVSSKQSQSKPDNQEYLDCFDEPLFLEDDDSNVTLASMYVSPHISGTSDKAADRIMDWFGKKSRKTCMLLFGGAGIGKSTLVSKIIADANRDGDDREFPLQADQVLAVALRNHCDDIDTEKKSHDILKDLFPGYTIDELRSKLLILDGLDEICVLRRDFNGFWFLNKLSSIGSGFHVLVTSREAADYFTVPADIPGIQINHLKWEKDELIAWCDKYADAKEEKRTWCEQFVREYTDMLKRNADDGRKDIFCVPIILYICATSGIQLSDHNSVGSIYDDAFRSILLRDHIQYQEGRADLAAADAETNANLIAWQYTKELAYQMFLLNTLDLAESGDPEHPRTMGLKNAKIRTKAFLKEKYGLDVNDDSLELKKELALCPFTRSNSIGGITFAHKSVYEYFTAVKLYEDYFAQFDAQYFDKTKPQTEDAAKAVAESYINAFRYRWIPAEIFAYLNFMQQPPFSGSPKVSAGGFDAAQFLQAYGYGMEKSILSRIAVNEPVAEYNYWPDPISTQFNRSFQNFTWFLTGHGFTNANNNIACEQIQDLLTLTDANVCLKGWDLYDVDLHDTNLSTADLSGADLSNAKLFGADLSGANLIGADLNCANLFNTNLSSADLKDADLSGANCTCANLVNADLRSAILSKTQLAGARYCRDANIETWFPDDFAPEEHDMIEIDIIGIPVEK